MAIVEYARNVVGLKDVYSAEIKPQAKTKIVEIMEEQKKQMNLGGTMRLGETEVKFAKDSKIAKIYGCLKIGERHRHRFEMNNEYIAIFRKKGNGFFWIFCWFFCWLFCFFFCLLCLLGKILTPQSSIFWGCSSSLNSIIDQPKELVPASNPKIFFIVF